MKPSYEELEARCSALAAENAGLKGALNKIAFTYPLSPHIHEMTKIQTPVTDAFLAEVRAQGVEMLNTQFKKCTGMLYADSVVSTAEHFAAQLRKGVQS
ncbi:hypothetical protein ACS6JK_01575 [Enterobacter chuandaensis]|uniref:hypothetical protein n=1 Tax=Enterobacter chuandaensis TaxID=2497875 RepID=UPI003F42B972